MKCLRFKCRSCGLTKDVPLDSTFDNLDERTIHKRLLITKVFNSENQTCDHCGGAMNMVGVVDA